MTYTIGALGAVACGLIADLVLTRRRLVATRSFWVGYAIVLIGQLVTNGVLTGLPVVTYDPAVLTGMRIAFAPLEDLGFGFGLVLSVLTTWSWLNRRSPG